MERDSQRLLGPWRLERELGRGNFGVVFLAERVDQPGQKVALKVLLEEAADDELLARFQLEIEVTRALEHPGIVRLLESGRTGGRTWYAMEYVKGPTLQQRLQEEQKLPPAEAVRIVAALARAAHVAHERGIVHRDLKPANVILAGPQAAPRITDFGLARAPALLRSLTKTGDMVGTPMVMAPEQLRGERTIDQRIDVHALGATLYRCLTGRWPRTAPTLPALLEALKTEPVEPPSRHQPGISPDLDAACLRALASDPSERHQTALDLAIELESAALEPPPPARRGIGARGLAALLALLGLGLASGVVAMSLADAPPPPPPPPVVATPPPVAPPPPVEPRPISTAPAAELRAIELGLLERTRIMDEHEDRSALEEAIRLAPLLLERHPGDLRVELLARLAGMLDSRGRGPVALEVRRLAIRAAAQEPPPGDVTLGFAGRLCLELGFQRAAADLLARVVRSGRVEDGWAGLSRVQVLMKTDPPVRDWETAVETARASIALHERTGGPSDRHHPPTWDLHCNLGELLWALGDLEGAGDAYRAGANAAQKPEAREGLARIGEAIRSGRIPREQALLGVATRFPLDAFTAALSSPEDRLQAERRIDPAAAASELERLAEAARQQGEPAHAALAELRAARAWRRAEEPESARRALERARTQGPQATEDLDVKLLIARELARQLVTVDPALAEQLARETVAAWPAGETDLRTSGELAEGWVLVGRAALGQDRREAAQAALAEAERLAPPDRRELEGLRAELGR